MSAILVLILFFGFCILVLGVTGIFMIRNQIKDAKKINLNKYYVRKHSHKATV